MQSRFKELIPIFQVEFAPDLGQGSFAPARGQGQMVLESLKSNIFQ